MSQDAVLVSGDGLNLADLVRVARQRAPVRLSGSPAVLGKIRESEEFVRHAVHSGQAIYGVTTSFGANANEVIPQAQVEDFQNNALWLLKAGVGELLPECVVRAAMLARLNSLVRGVSGIRLELLQRFVTFLNEGIHPHLFELGSIGASGDLIPLSYIAACIVGAPTGHTVTYEGRRMKAAEALQTLGLAPLPLKAKEGLALINGTSVMTGMAALCLHESNVLLALAMGVHALAFQAFCAREQPMAPFIHAHKPHPGQIRSAQVMRRLLEDSRMTWEGMDGHVDRSPPALIQDRYSLRCLPQYMAPIYEGLDGISRQIEIELNSANDNPLVDAPHQMIYNGGNFLGQNVGVAMDHLRYYIGLTAKHLDVQLALLVTPEFSNGLPPSLIGNRKRQANVGFKSLQILGNSIMPILSFLGNSIVDRYPTHAEQFNQNINSQGFNSANLARQSVATFRNYMAAALMMAVQAVDLRSKLIGGDYDARSHLAPASCRLYEAVRAVVGVPPASERPYVFDDDDIHRDEHLRLISDDILSEGSIVDAVGNIMGAVSVGEDDAETLAAGSRQPVTERP